MREEIAEVFTEYLSQFWGFEPFHMSKPVRTPTRPFCEGNGSALDILRPKNDSNIL